jgi:NAD(P)-dependent dehydrogenase (short-subunit alcohol dehydrogenase family)
MDITVITGASGGVAMAAAQRLIDQGEQVRLLTRKADQVRAALPQLNAAHVIDVDVLDAAQLNACFARIADETSSAPNRLLHSVGNTLIAGLSRTTPDALRNVLSINVESAFYAAQAFVAQLQAAKAPGSAVFFSSVVAGIGVSNHPAIAAAKGAIEAMTRSLAADFAASQIRFNCIAPGLMRSPMTEKMLVSESAQKQIAAQYPLGFYGAADDAALAALFLLGEQSRWITGTVMPLDGGFSAVRPMVRS